MNQKHQVFSYAESIEIIKKGSGSHFDPELVTLFEQIAEECYLQLSIIKKEDILSQKLDLLIKDYFFLKRLGNLNDMCSMHNMPIGLLKLKNRVEVPIMLKQFGSFN